MNRFIIRKSKSRLVETKKSENEATGLRYSYILNWLLLFFAVKKSGIFLWYIIERNILLQLLKILLKTLQEISICVKVRKDNCETFSVSRKEGNI